jgi:hypothetical protein
MAYKQVEVTKGLSEAVLDAYGEFQCLRDEVREAMEGLEERFSGTQRYQTLESTADELDGFCDEEVDVPEDIAQAAITFTESRNRSTKRAPSRAVRCGNACAALEAVINAVEEKEEEVRADDDRGKSGDALLEELSDFREKLQEHIDVAQGLDFPSR